MSTQPDLHVPTGMSATERKLWSQYRTSPSAIVREQLVERYAPLIRYVIARLPVRLPVHVEHDDLLGYGAVGLLEAIDRFDPNLGIKFETFARKRIRGAALDALRSQSALSRGAQELVRTVSATYARLEMELGREVEDLEVATELGITSEELDEAAVLASFETLSLDQPLHQFDGTAISLGETLGDEAAEDPSEQAVYAELLRSLTTGVERLPERERILLGLYYIEGLTMQEIAEVFGVTKPRVCQLHARALWRLRTYLEPQETTAARNGNG